jgi:hypothetical protein
MRIVAYVVSSVLGVVGWAAVLVALLAVSPWLALGWVLALALALAGWAVQDARRAGVHRRGARRGPQDGRRAPNGPGPTLDPPGA